MFSSQLRRGLLPSPREASHLDVADAAAPGAVEGDALTLEVIKHTY